MGTCWSGLFSTLRSPRPYRDQDGFLIEMNSLDFGGFENSNSNISKDNKNQNIQEIQREEKASSNESHQNQFGSRHYFTLGDSTSNSFTSHSDLRMEEDRKPVKKANYREILDPSALKFFFNKQNFRKLSKEEVNSNSNLQSKAGSVVSVDLEWEHEGCISMYDDEISNAPKVTKENISNISTLEEENGNLTFQRWPQTQSHTGLNYSESQASNITEGSGNLNSPSRKLLKTTRALSGSSLVWDTSNSHQMYGVEDNSGVFDHEAEQLINEIDALTSRALKETATWASYSEDNMADIASTSSLSRADVTSSSSGRDGARDDVTAFPRKLADNNRTADCVMSRDHEDVKTTSSSRQSDAMISSLDTDSSI